MIEKIQLMKVFRFLFNGFINTILGYFIYVALLSVVPYKIAYSVSFFLGIIISYLTNSIFVFKSVINMRKAIFFLTVYFSQYAISLFLLVKFVDVGVDKLLAPWIVLAFVVPVNYLVFRKIL